VQVGSSLAFDLGVCLALGVASTACVVSSIVARSALSRHIAASGLQWLARVLSLLLHLGGVISIAVVLGSMQSSLHRYSLFAYVIGILLALPLLVFASRHVRTA
jgi:hypothetical protein